MFLSSLSIIGCLSVLLVQGAPTPRARCRDWESPDASASSDRGWPHVRGPDYNGVSSAGGLAESWPSDGPPLLWRIELGKGYSSFAAVGDRVYTQFQTIAGQYVVCLDAQTGSEIWRHRYDWPWDGSGIYPGPYATPTVRDGRVFFAAPSGLVGCLDAATGREIWSVNVTKKYQGKGTEFGFANSPLVEDGKVILPIGGVGASVVALDARDGSQVWASGDEPASYCPAYAITIGGRRVVVVFLQNMLVAHDLATGERLWRHDASRGYDEHAAWPLFQDPFLLISAPFKAGSQVFRLDVESGQGPRRVWDNAELSNDVCSSVVVDGYVYGFDLRDIQARAHRPSKGKFKCLKLATGEVQWSTDRVGHASVIAADGKLLLFNDTGWLILARASADAYDELGRVQIFSGEICWTAPALHRGRVFLRSRSEAACVFVGMPESLDRERVQPLAAAPKIKMRLNLIWLLGHEPEFPFVSPSVDDLSLWFVFSAAAIALAGTIGAVVFFVLRLPRVASASRWARGVFCASVFVLGVCGTPFIGHLRDEFVLTWPVSLFAAFHITLARVVASRHQSASRRSRWVSRLIGLAFVALCFGYYELCRYLCVPMAWGFLVGFILASPVVVPLAYWIMPRRALWSDAVLLACSFTAYFWASGAFMAWRMSLR